MHSPPLPRQQAIKAEADGADYLGAGAVFPTGTKESDVIGLDALAQICQVGMGYGADGICKSMVFSWSALAWAGVSRLSIP